MREEGEVEREGRKEEMRRGMWEKGVGRGEYEPGAIQLTC